MPALIIAHTCATWTPSLGALACSAVIIHKKRYNQGRCCASEREQAMIEPLREVIEQMERLTPDEQAAIAAQIQRHLEELEDERGWQERFQDPRGLDALDRMIEEAIAEDEAGETVALDEVLRGIKDDKTV